MTSMGDFFDRLKLNWTYFHIVLGTNKIFIKLIAV